MFKIFEKSYLNLYSITSSQNKIKSKIILAYYKCGAILHNRLHLPKTYMDAYFTRFTHNMC